jgi:glutamate carboxypeptidase
MTAESQITACLAAQQDVMIALLREMVDIDSGSYNKPAKAELEVRGEFLPLVQSPMAKRLFEIYVQSAAKTGFKTDGEFTGGCADCGFTAGVGTPTICAVGPVGGKAHSPDEFLLVDSLAPRAQACARAIPRLAQGGL